MRFTPWPLGQNAFHALAARSFLSQRPPGSGGCLGENGAAAETVWIGAEGSSIFCRRAIRKLPLLAMVIRRTGVDTTERL